MLSCHDVIALDPQGNDMVKQRDSDLEPRELWRDSFSKWGGGNSVIFPKDYWGTENTRVKGYGRLTDGCPSFV
jgi:hypothetical protein